MKRNKALRLRKSSMFCAGMILLAVSSPFAQQGVGTQTEPSKPAARLAQGNAQKTPVAKATTKGR
jgi:hypothetical protein